MDFVRTASGAGDAMREVKAAMNPEIAVDAWVPLGPPRCGYGADGGAAGRVGLLLEQRRERFARFLHLGNGIDNDIRVSGIPLNEVLMRLLGGEELR